MDKPTNIKCWLTGKIDKVIYEDEINKSNNNATNENLLS